MNTEDTTQIQLLRKQAAFSLSLLSSLNKEPFTTTRDLVLRHCVERSVELEQTELFAVRTRMTPFMPAHE